MRGFKKCISAVLAAALVLTALPVNGTSQVQAAEGAKADATVKVLPEGLSTFNDTDGDGLGEFQGWGTSLCWWANRLGYDTTLTKKAADAFFGDGGLDLNIGRYNVGGGDNVGDVPLVTPNDAAVVYGVEGESAPAFGGSKMKVEANEKLKDAAYKFSDADFGITKGTKVGSLKQIGWVNELGAENGEGGNLDYTVTAPKAGNYTVKMLWSLEGDNKRAAAIRVNGDASKDIVVSAADVNKNEIALGTDKTHLFLVTFSNVPLKAGTNHIAIGGNAAQSSDGKESWGLNFVKMLVVESGKEGVLPEEDPFLHPSHIRRSDSAIPGYWADVTKIKITEDKPISWWKANYARADEACGYAWNYDWDADKNQMNILKAAKEASGADFIAEAFSNSPPYFMTNSGCSSGAADPSKDNLRKDSYKAFAAYMTDVIAHWAQEGVVDFQSATPMNEPYTAYWVANSNKQEGCHFDIGESESTIIVELKKELARKAEEATDARVKAALTNIILSGTDETSIDTAIDAYNALSSEAKKSIARIDTHTYSGSKRKELSALAQKANKNLWMSEIDGATMAGTNAGEMSAALGFARQIIGDMNGLKCSAWIMWNAVDVHVDRNNEFDTNTLEELKTNYIDGDPSKGHLYDPENASYWGIAIGDHNNKDLVLTRKYYAYGQFSKYIRPGYTIMGTSDEGNTLIAYDKAGKKLVIVAINTAAEDKTWKFDLSRFEKMGSSITAHRTSGASEGGESWKDLTAAEVKAAADTAGKSFTATVKANSITTFEVAGVEYDKAKDDERIKREEDLRKMQTEVMSVVDLSNVDLDANKITLTEGMISSSAPWNNGTTDVAKNVIDGNFDSFFDGVDNGYVQFDLGEGNAKAIVAYGYAPRKDSGNSKYQSRCVGASLYGSNNGTDWDQLHTITETPEAGKLTHAYMNEFHSASFMGKAYRYYKYAVGSSGNCNVAELALYALPQGMELPSLPSTLGEWITHCKTKTKDNLYEKTSKEKYDKALAAAEGLKSSATAEEKDNAMYALFDAYLNLKRVYNYDSISGVKGEARYDDKGDLIQAHGGQIQKITYDYDYNGNGKIDADEHEFWYWIGEDKTNDYRPCPGVRAYISKDLFNWKDMGDVLRTVPNWETFTTEKYFTDLYGDLSEADQKKAYADIWTADDDVNSGCVIERPKMIYNDKYDQYVIWFHADGQTPDSTGGNYAKAKAGIAVSKSPFGPFKMQGSYLLNYADGMDRGFDGDVGGHVRDMNVFKDDDGTGYVIYSSDGNRNMYIAKMNDSYTNIAKTNDEGAIQGVDYTVNFVGSSREAPAMFKYDGKYYLVTSGCTGWSPNPGQYAVADKPMGPWTVKGDPCTDTEEDSPYINAAYTYYTQSTCVFEVAKGQYIYMGDRWYNPEIGVGPGAGGSLRNSRYVWLPVEFTADNGIALRAYSDWKMDVFEGIEPYKLKTVLPDRGTTLPSQIKIQLASEEQERTVNVTWDMSAVTDKKLGEVNIDGTFKYTKGAKEYERKITHKMTLIDEKMIYFFDCASDVTGGTEYFDLLKGVLAESLRNADPDQKYSVENYAGYDGNRGESNIQASDTQYDFAMKDDSGNDMWSQGYWATRGKTIKYSFILEAGTYTVAAGFHEWWNDRKQTVTVASNGKTLASSEEFTLKKNVNYQQNTDFTLEENAKVTVTVSANGADPVLSWIALMQNTKTGSFPTGTDTKELDEVIETADNEEEGDYTAASWEKFQNALAKAKEVQKYILSTPDDIAAAAAELNDAMANLQTPAEYLEASIETIAISDTNKDNYEKDAMWTYYEKVLADTKALAGKAGLTEEEADAALKDLRDTVDLLTPVKKTEEPEDPPKPPVKQAQTITLKVKTSISKKASDKAFALGAKASGGGKLTYKSSNKKVAKVSTAGKVTLKGAGVCTITVNAGETEKYKKASKNITLTVSPKKATVSSAKPVKGKKLTVKWKKDATVTGYEIQCCPKKNFKSGVKKATVEKAKTTSTTFKKLKKGKKYYVRVRAYKIVKVNGKKKTLTGAWSKVKTSGKVK